MSEAPQTKICRKCKVEKPIDEFGILSSSVDGHNAICFDCRRIFDRNSRAEKANKARRRDRKSITDKSGTAGQPEKKIIAQQDESAEAQLIKAFKKTTIKAFIKDDLIPMLERTIEEKYGRVTDR